jgi:sulfur carrier protein ThiS
MMRSICNLERRERDLNPRVQGTVDFESTAIPGYATSALNRGSSATVISMMFARQTMEIHFHGTDIDAMIEVDAGTTVRTALQTAGILPSMVIVSYEGTVLPHSTPLNQSVSLLVTTISSGG